MGGKVKGKMQGIKSGVEVKWKHHLQGEWWKSQGEEEVKRCEGGCKKEKGEWEETAEEGESEGERDLSK